FDAEADVVVDDPDQLTGDPVLAEQVEDLLGSAGDGLSLQQGANARKGVAMASFLVERQRRRPSASRLVKPIRPVATNSTAPTMSSQNRLFTAMPSTTRIAQKTSNRSNPHGTTAFWPRRWVHASSRRQG